MLLTFFFTHIYFLLFIIYLLIIYRRLHTH